MMPFDIFAAMDLRPACDAWTNIEHPELFRRVFIHRPWMIGQRRARADERHVAPKDVDELRQFVDARDADDSADACHAGVVLP